MSDLGVHTDPRREGRKASPGNSHLPFLLFCMEPDAGSPSALLTCWSIMPEYKYCRAGIILLISEGHFSVTLHHCHLPTHTHTHTHTHTRGGGGREREREHLPCVTQYPHISQMLFSFCLGEKNDRNEDEELGSSKFKYVLWHTLTV
jgi:hypothetical protein